MAQDFWVLKLKTFLTALGSIWHGKLLVRGLVSFPQTIESEDNVFHGNLFTNYHLLEISTYIMHDNKNKQNNMNGQKKKMS